jgi:hypothetical protein
VVETQLQWHMQMIVLFHFAKPLFTGVSVNLALTPLMLGQNCGGGVGCSRCSALRCVIFRHFGHRGSVL